VNRPVIPPDPNVAAVSDSWAIAGQAGRLGIELAGKIAGEFSRLVPGTAPSDVRQDPGRALRSAQVQLERTVSGVLEALGDAIDSYADLAGDAANAMQARSSPGLETVVVSAGPLRSGAVVLWIHNTTDDDAGELLLRPTAFVDADGIVLDAEVEVGDETQVDVAAGASRSVVLTVTPAVEVAPGRYHGMVLVGGVPDALVHVRVDVEPGER
jgi:hypothetical protein